MQVGTQFAKDSRRPYRQRPRARATGDAPTLTDNSRRETLAWRQSPLHQRPNPHRAFLAPCVLTAAVRWVRIRSVGACKSPCDVMFSFPRGITSFFFWSLVRAIFLSQQMNLSNRLEGIGEHVLAPTGNVLLPLLPCVESVKHFVHDGIQV